MMICAYGICAYIGMSGSTLQATQYLGSIPLSPPTLTPSLPYSARLAAPLHRHDAPPSDPFAVDDGDETTGAF